MDINNLLLICGDQVKIQPLDHCFTKFNAANSRNPTRIEFGTEADVYVNMVPGGVTLKGRDQGIVLWLPREKVSQAIAGDDAPQEPAENAKFQAALTVQLALQAAIAAGALEGCEVAEANALLGFLDNRIGSHEPI